jgi:Spy/CpxP family protein refolding chaperone
MRTKFGVVLLTLVSALAVAQGPSTMPGPGRPGGFGGQKQMMTFRHEMGAWWKNSKVAEKLKLSDAQIKQLEDTFYQHRLKLVDLSATMQIADMKLQRMLDADTVNEAAVNSQVDQVLAARGNMEREFTTMNLNFRKILTLDQWKQLRAMQSQQMHDRTFFRGPGRPGARGPGAGGPGPGPGPGPQSELMPEYLPLPEAGAN